MGGPAFGFQFLGFGTALGFERLRHFVEADERERILVDIFKAGEYSAPNLSLLSQKKRRTIGRRVSGLLLILDAPQAWNMAKADSAFAPLGVGGDDIFGNKSDARWVADQLVLI